MMRLTFATATAVSLLAVGIQAQTGPRVVPMETEYQEGNSWHFVPFGNTNMRYQHFIAAKHLKNIQPTPGTPVVIHGLSFRHEGHFAKTTPATSRNLVIIISETTTSTLVGATNLYSTTFANNYVAPATPPNGNTAPQVVWGNRTGAGTTTSPYVYYPTVLAIPGATTSNSAGYGKEVVKIKFTRPYIYRGPQKDATGKLVGGNLFVEIISFATTKKDAQGRIVGAAGANTAAGINVDRTYGGSATATTYGFDGASCPTGKNNISIYTTNMKPGGTMRTLLSAADVNTAATAKPTAVLLIGSGVIDSIIGTGPGLAKSAKGDLTPFGAPGCTVLTQALLVAAAAITTTGRADLSVPIPNVPAVANNTVNAQWMVIDNKVTKTNVMGLTFSAKGSRYITATGGMIYDMGYAYWNGGTATAPVNPGARTLAQGKWGNRGDVMVLYLKP